MRFNFVNIQAYEIKLTRKFKYTENLACAHVTQIDIDACYEWRPSTLQVVFVWLPSLSKYMDARTCLFVKGTN